MTGAPPWCFSTFLRYAPPPSALFVSFRRRFVAFRLQKFFVSVFLSRNFSVETFFVETFSSKLFVKAFVDESS
jgi:hypothetical protein